jgi:hypothetical protein
MAKRLVAFVRSVRMLGFLLVLFGLAIVLNLLSFASLLQMNDTLMGLEHDARWRLALARVEHAWLEQGLLLRRSLLTPLSPPEPEAFQRADDVWQGEVVFLRSLSSEQDTIDYLVSLPPVARGAFQQALQQERASSRQAALNRAFSTNQAIDNLLDDQSFLATNRLSAGQARLQALVARYNGIALVGISLLGVLGLWALLWASRLPQPLLIIRMALAAAASGNYQPELLAKLMPRDNSFGELARAVHRAVTHLQDEETALRLQADELRHKLQNARRTRLGGLLVNAGGADDDRQ